MRSQISPHLLRQRRHLVRNRGSRSTPCTQVWRRAFIFASTLSLHNGLTTEFFYNHRLESQWSASPLRKAPVQFPWGTKRFMSGESGDKDGKDDTASSDKQRVPIKDPRKYILSKSTIPEDQIILESTLDWVQNVVIGMNFCPFAEKPFKSQQMHLEVIQGRDENEILARVLGECIVRQSKPGTSLLICPDLYPNNFQTFLQVYNMLNDGVLVDNELTDDVQIAPFHPLFEFDGSGHDGVDNYTNRSPYPIFHVLREEEVGRAVDLLDGDASKVWRRNVEFLEALSEELELEHLKAVITGKPTDRTIGEKVKAILHNLKRKTTEM